MDIVYWWGVTMSLFEDDPNLIRRQERQVREQAERARAMRQRIESVQGVGVSPDSSVEIIVDSAGKMCIRDSVTGAAPHIGCSAT